MASRWPEVAPDLRAWRQAVVAALAAIPEPRAVVSHYVAINVAVGAAMGDDRVTVFAPDHCSVTVIEMDEDALRLIERGAEGATRVL